MKTGIITYHRVHNFGAFLQSRALCLRLNQEEDIQAEIIDFDLRSNVEEYSLKRKFKSWIKHPERISFDRAVYRTFKTCQKNGGRLLSEESTVGQNCRDFAEFVRGKYDVIIAGSDEIWKVNDIKVFPLPYWLAGNLGCRKFSYAASSRSELSSLPEKQYGRLRKILADFEYIGVRDEPTYKEICAVTDPSKVHMNCDPSFIYDFDVTIEAYDAVLKRNKIDRSENKIAVIMTKNDGLAEHIRYDLEGKYTLISVFHHHKGYINIGALTPFEWLTLIRFSDIVLSSYYHACCFSIIYNKPYIAFGDKNKSSKLEALSKEFSLTERYFPEHRAVKDIYLQAERLSFPPERLGIVMEKRESFNDFLSALRQEE